MVRITVELPQSVHQAAKSAAAKRGIPLRQLIVEAVQERLKVTPPQKPWMKHVGRLKHLHEERTHLENRVDEAFEHIDREDYVDRVMGCLAGGPNMVAKLKKDRRNEGARER
jgi:hypothetical protein